MKGIPGVTAAAEMPQKNLENFGHFPLE